MGQIVGVAVLIAPGLILSAPRPARHDALVHRFQDVGVEDPGPEAQGFITSDGHFLDRYEAVRYARHHKQILAVKRCQPPDMLFSEDLW